MPTLILLAGPNGAGKTTFINAFLRRRPEPWVFVNPDEIARELPGGGPERDLAAGRLVLERLEAVTAARLDVVLETTLATRSHARRIVAWRRAGYRVELIYLRLPSAEESLARVRRRVSEGGHAIPEADIRRRYPRSLEYLETLYKPNVDEWEVWSAGGDTLVLLEESPR